MNKNNPEDYFFFTTVFVSISTAPGASWPGDLFTGAGRGN